MELSSNIFYLLANIILLISAIIGIIAISTFREKKLMTCFNFFSMFRIRLKHLLLIYNAYSFEIHESFFPQINRNYREEIKSADAFYIISETSKSAKSCIHFLMTAKDQLPPSSNWECQIALLLEFLTDLSFLEQKTHCKWVDNKDNRKTSEEYFSEHIKNINNIIETIEKQLAEYEKILNKKK